MFVSLREPRECKNTRGTRHKRDTHGQAAAQGQGAAGADPCRSFSHTCAQPLSFHKEFHLSPAGRFEGRPASLTHGLLLTASPSAAQRAPLAAGSTADWAARPARAGSGGADWLARRAGAGAGRWLVGAAGCRGGVGAHWPRAQGSHGGHGGVRAARGCCQRAPPGAGHMEGEAGTAPAALRDGGAPEEPSSTPVLPFFPLVPPR